MKLKKNSLVILGLATVALGTIGFSSWIISAQTATLNPEVNVIVGNVVDQRIFLEAVQKQPNLDLAFDAQSNASGAGTIVTASENSKEDLTFKISFVLGSSSMENFKTVFANKAVAIKFESEVLNTLIEGDCIQSPISLGTEFQISGIDQNITNTTSAISGGNFENPKSPLTPVEKYKVTFSEGSFTNYTGEGVKVDIEFNFAWGSAFKFQNPVYLTELGSDTNTALTVLDGVSDSTKLNVTISVVNRTQA